MNTTTCYWLILLLSLSQVSPFILGRPSSPTLLVYSKHSKSNSIVLLSTSSSSSDADEARKVVAKNESSISSVQIHPNIFEYVGVRPFVILKGRPLRRRLSLLTWKTRGLVLKILHARDPLKPPNSCINLECLWYKALAANNRSSPIYDNGLTNDLLPTFSRFVVARPWLGFYPRLVHGRLECRSAYLEHAIGQEIEFFMKQGSVNTVSNKITTKVRMITIGAGYEIRSVKLLSGNIVDECVDIDLPEVVAMKERLFASRLRKRRPQLRDCDFPTLIGVDLNDVGLLRQHLQKILLRNSTMTTPTTTDKDDGKNAVIWHTIFVAEGVLMYLKEGNSRRVLQTCAQEAAAVLNQDSSASASLCFADRLGNLTDVKVDECEAELARAGWKLVDWAPNQYLNAKHIGTARLLVSPP